MYLYDKTKTFKEISDFTLFICLLKWPLFWKHCNHNKIWIDFQKYFLECKENKFFLEFSLPDNCWIEKKDKNCVWFSTVIRVEKSTLDFYGRLESKIQNQWNVFSLSQTIETSKSKARYLFMYHCTSQL